MIKIYALIDPKSNKIKYIGQTSEPLSYRLSSHISKSKRNKNKTPKSEWIRELLSKGLRPGIILLEEVDVNQKKEAESRWIIKHKKTILNVAPPGAGGEYGHKIDYSKRPDIISLFGKKSDSIIAEMLGVSRKAISYQRKKRGIKASYDTSRMKPPPYMGGWNKIDLPESIISRLGKLPDYILASEIGVDKKVISKERRDRKIPSYAQKTGKDGRFKKGDPHPRWSHKKQSK